MCCVAGVIFSAVYAGTLWKTTTKKSNSIPKGTLLSYQLPKFSYSEVLFCSMRQQKEVSLVLIFLPSNVDTQSIKWFFHYAYPLLNVRNLWGVKEYV